MAVRALPALRVAASYLAALAIAALCIYGLAINHFILPYSADARAYWNAAERILSGQELYIPINPESNPYLYAPWVALIWVGLHIFQWEIALGIWQAFGLVAAIYVLRRAGLNPVTIALAVPLLVAVWLGNVQVFLVAVLVYGITHHRGPLPIALAISTKIVPVAYVAVWLGRGEPRKVTVTLLWTLALALPALWFGLDGYPFGMHRFQSGANRLILAGAIILTLYLTLRLSRTRWAWLAASVLVLLATPQHLLYDWSWLLVGWVAARQGLQLRQHELGRDGRSRDDIQRPARGLIGL